MAKVLVNESSLTGIANAIRGKNGSADTYKPSEMAAAITAISGGGGYNIPDEAFVISENCDYRFANNAWNWFIENYGNKITTKDIMSGHYMFANSGDLEAIPFNFDLKFDSYYSYNLYDHMFLNCYKLKTIGKLIYMYPSSINQMFYDCYNLRYLPEFVSPNFSRINTYAYANASSMLHGCYSLRTISEDLLNQIYGTWTSYSYAFFSNLFNSCYTLDEVRGLNPQTGKITGDMFSTTFYYCSRLKNIIFALQDNGTPYVVNWKNQAINLSSYVGYSQNTQHILNYNSGITADKRVTDATTYAALKDDPDWWTTDIAYSRYNHDSAVATINSLPDASAYLAANGGTNTIQFKGAAGSATDGGAINTLTEEEIAVATAKGWTVTLV